MVANALIPALKVGADGSLSSRPAQDSQGCTKKRNPVFKKIAKVGYHNLDIQLIVPTYICKAVCLILELSLLYVPPSLSSTTHSLSE